MAAALVFGGIVLVAVAAPIIAPYPYEAQDLRNRFEPPSLSHPFGTDDFGRDQLSRAIFGARNSLAVAAGAVGLSVLVGSAIGLQAGYFGGFRGALLMRLTDAVMAFPSFFLILAVTAIVGPSLINVTLIIGLTTWTVFARLVRGEVLSLRTRDFIIAARVMGCSPMRIMLRHLLPNLAAPLIVLSTLHAAFVILTEATVSFLGLGIRPPAPSWGNMLTVAQRDMFVAPWVVVVPGGLIVLTVMCLNFIGDGLRESLDPRLSRG
jgi:peptide/nickel transport system permease protein